MAENNTNGETMADLVEEFKNAQVEDRKNIIIRAAELQDYEEKKEQRDEELEKLLDDGIKKQMGETGFRGIIKNTTENFKKLITEQKSMSELFGDLKSSFSTDLSFITMALAPLTSIPGMTTAIGVIKFAIKLLWKGIQMFWAWQKAMRAKDNARARLTGLATEKTEGGADTTTVKKNWFLAFFGKLMKRSLQLLIFLGALIVGFFLALTKPFRAVVAAVWRLTIGRALGAISPAIGSWITRNILTPLRSIKAQILHGFFGKRGGVSVKGLQGFQRVNIFGRIGAAFSMFRGVGTHMLSMINRIKPVINGLGSFFRMIGQALHGIGALRIIGFATRLAGWLTFYVVGPIIGLMGFFSGWKDTKGDWHEKFIGGIMGMTGALIDFFFIFWLDLAKDIISWIGKKLGFDMSWLEGWTFSDLWDTVWSAWTDLLLKFTRFVKAILAGIWAGIKAPWSPMDAFSAKYNEVLSQPVGLTSVSDDATDVVKAPGPTKAESIENYNRMRERDTGGPDTAAGRAMAAIQNNNTTNNNTNISVLESVVPGDPTAAALAAQFE